MSQKDDPQRASVEGNAKSPLERLKGSVLHYDKPFEPADSENWEADILEPSTATRRLDRIEAHNSAEKSAAVMRTFPNIAHEWGLQDTDMAALLGINADTYREWEATPSQAELSVEQLERASNMLGIYRSLTLLLPQVEHQQRWLHHLIDNAHFNGLSPMELMHRGGLPALRSLRDYLDAQRQRGFS